jgi:hypothetical protein
VSAIILEGGASKTTIEEDMTAVRKAVVLDNIEKMRETPGIDQVILGTNYADLAAQAETLGAVVDFSLEPFHFGRRVLRIVGERGLTSVLYMGGAAAPLIRREDLAWMAKHLREEEGIAILNNPQSPDMVGFTPASAITLIPPPQSDNELGYALTDLAGLRRVMVPNSPWVSFDLDTPTDLAILSLQRTAGRRTTRALSELSFRPDLERLAKALGRVESMFSVIGSEIALIGRVGPPIWAFLNMNVKVRFRVFSEERGMKALGRQDRGEVVSLVGHFIDREGPEPFFAYLGTICQAALFDSRVLFAHWKKQVSDWDRFQSDLGRFDLIQDPEVREFARAAQAAAIPIILGGHALVSGGLWLLAEDSLAVQGLEANRLMQF